ncbi:MAG: hypothetical protein N3E37_01270 [Candidatus Micrarchaeota archaeon]|nr:hypothetical protein [Candidatus Micrarchaeota archaeon]
MVSVVLSANKFAYVVLGISAAALLIAFTLPTANDYLTFVKILATFLTALTALISLLIYKYGYIIIPQITKRLKITTPLPLYFEISPTQDTILATDGNLYYASAFVGLNIFKSAIERPESEMTTYMKSFERAISGLRYVTKISYLIYVIDITKKRESIKEKIYTVQYKLNREREKTDPDPITIEKLENELALWQTELERLTAGNKPMAIVAYVQTTAIGVSREQAVAVAKRQAEEIKAWIQNSLAVDARILTAEDMLRCFDWEFMIPREYAELDQQLN